MNTFFTYSPTLVSSQITKTPKQSIEKEAMLFFCLYWLVANKQPSKWYYDIYTLRTVVLLIENQQRKWREKIKKTSGSKHEAQGIHVEASGSTLEVHGSQVEAPRSKCEVWRSKNVASRSKREASGSKREASGRLSEVSGSKHEAHGSKNEVLHNGLFIGFWLFFTKNDWFLPAFYVFLKKSVFFGC